MDKSEVRTVLLQTIQDMDTEIPVIVHDGPYDSEVISGPVYIPDASAWDWKGICGCDIGTDQSSLIFVPADVFYEWEDLHQSDIYTILQHEYGHHLTFRHFDDETMLEEIFRSFVFELILLSHPQISKEEYDIEYYFFRHHLPSERLASEACSVTMDDIQQTLLHQSGYKPTNEFEGVDVGRLLTKPPEVDPRTVTRERVVDVIMDYLSDIVMNDDTLHRLPEIIDTWWDLFEADMDRKEDKKDKE